MAPPNPPFPRHTGPVDLEVIAFGPVHGYASRSASNKFRAVSSKCRKGRSTRLCTASKPWPSGSRLERNGDRARGEFYLLTRKGLKQLKTETADWQRLIDAIGLILGMADGGAR